MARTSGAAPAARRPEALVREIPCAMNPPLRCAGSQRRRAALQALVVLARRRAEEDPLDLGRRAAAEPQRGLDALVAELAGVERTAQLVQRRQVLLARPARGPSRAGSGGGAALQRGGHAQERLALLGRRSPRSRARPSGGSPGAWRPPRRAARAARSSSSSSADAPGEQRLDLAQRQQRGAILDQPLEEGVELGRARRRRRSAGCPGE